MATILAVLTSARRKGFTAGLLERAATAAGAVPGVQVQVVCAHDFRFGPCVSCFACVRAPGAGCVLDDDMGHSGAGALYRLIASANALLIADPVHNWSPSAAARLLIERCYPFLWSGALKGIPAATISCASNQGMQRLARRELCKWLFGLRARYLGGVAAHVARLEHHAHEAEKLGRALGQAALSDERGRQAWDDRDAFEHYTRHAPWDPLECYLDNLTEGTFAAQSSIITSALREGGLQCERARELLQRAQQGLERTLELYRAGDRPAAARALADASSFWTHATWTEFLQARVIGVPQPDAYRPLPPGQLEA